jgi:exoribonuclease R
MTKDKGRSKSPKRGRKSSPKRSTSPKPAKDGCNVGTAATTSASSDGRSNHRRHHHHHRHNHHHHPESLTFPPDISEKGVDVVNRIFRCFGLVDKFPDACQQQVKDIQTKDPVATNLEEDGGGSNIDTPDNGNELRLVDLTHLPYITIDNDNSLDLDQAMYICKAICPPPLPLNTAEPTRPAAMFQYPDGIQFPKHDLMHSNSTTDDAPYNSYLVSYALADGAYYVPAFSPLFEHALKHSGSSFYLPGKAIPMLPRELSEDMMSLNPNVKRRALVFDMYLNLDDGHVIRTLYRYGVIVSQWKGTYREVSEYYGAVDNNQHHWIQDKPYGETVDLLRDIGQKRIDLAKQRNVVQYDRDNGDPVSIDPKTGMLVFSSTLASTKCDDDNRKQLGNRGGRYISELYNEQISLLCNTEGAKILAFLDDMEEKTGSQDILHPIYRTQSGPRTDQTRTLEIVIANTLNVNGLDVQEWGWNDQDEVLSSYLDRIRLHATSIDGETNSKVKQKWLRVVSVINRQAQITNQAASFSSSPEDGHHALKTTHYARFTSPMRELVGCFTHKELYEAHIGRFSNQKLSSKTDIECRYPG